MYIPLTLNLYTTLKGFQCVFLTVTSGDGIRQDTLGSQTQEIGDGRLKFGTV